MKRKGQIGGRELIALIVGMIVLFFALKLVTSVLNAASSPDALVNALIPLMVLAIFFEILRRIFG